jgi:hypothetical protein
MRLTEELAPSATLSHRISDRGAQSALDSPRTCPPEVGSPESPPDRLCPRQRNRLRTLSETFQPTAPG